MPTSFRSTLSITLINNLLGCAHEPPKYFSEDLVILRLDWTGSVSLSRLVIWPGVRSRRGAVRQSGRTGRTGSGTTITVLYL